MSADISATRMTGTDNDRWPSAGAAWYGVAMLMLAALIALLDRQILSLLVDPIRQSLKLTDTQMGVLQGPAFMISYSLLGIPVGWLVDRSNRLRLVAASIVIWSAGTVACGLADSYQTMIFARALVGAGEAVVSPATVSLIADYFSPTRRPMAMSVHGTAAMCGTGLSLIAAGGVMAASRDLAPISIGELPTIEGWRFVFVACAIPGFIAAALILSAHEPARRAERAGVESSGLWSFISRARAWLWTHFAAVCLIAVVSYAFMAWAPSLLIRRHGWAAADVGLAIGLLFLALGPVGILTGGYLTHVRQRRGQRDAAPRVLRIGTILVVTAIGSLGLPWPPAFALAPIAAAIFSISLLPSVAVIAVQHATPNHLRGQVAAIYFVTTNLVGYSVGPVAAGMVTQTLFRDPTDVNLSLATIALVAGPLILIMLALSMAPYRALIAGGLSTSDGGLPGRSP